MDQKSTEVTGSETQNLIQLPPNSIDELIKYKYDNKEVPIEEFITGFQRKVDEVKASGTDLSEDMLGYLILKNANLSEDEYYMVKDACKGLPFEEVKTKLVELTVNPPRNYRPKRRPRHSYANLIAQAIESSPDKRLTVAQIYHWLVNNVAYFKDKGNDSRETGWKNTVRHNLLLHPRFERTRIEGRSWWSVKEGEARVHIRTRPRYTLSPLVN